MSDIYVTYGDTSDIIFIDNEDTINGPNWNFAKTGDWGAATDSLAYGYGDYDDVYYWTVGSADPSDYTATWKPADIPAGEYEVFARWVAADDRSGSVPYTVTYASGVTNTVVVNQKKNSGIWISLGTYDFDEESGSVTVDLPGYDVAANGKVSIDAVKFHPTYLTAVEIPIAHYYTCEGSEEIIYDTDNQGNVLPDGNQCNGQVWLVIVDGGAMRYYQVNDADGDDIVDDGELTAVVEENVPDTVKSGRTYEEERQNFANWFTYYRKRDLLSRAVVSRVVTTLKGVNVGFRGLHGNISIPVKPIKVGDYDETSALLAGVYGFTIDEGGASTPLRRALEDVGQYFDLSDGDEDGGIGPSPIVSAEDGGGCQQNFLILFTDAYYNGLAAGQMDPDDGTPSEFSGYAPYKDDVGNNLADIAMNYYMRDLAPEVEDEVPTNPFDSARHQHMVTYTVTFGVIGTLNPEDYDLDACEEMYRGNFDFQATKDDDPQGPCPPWPSPSINTDQERIDDVFHAAVNGRGEFHSANNPEELIQAFKAVLDNIEARIGSAASVSVNGDELYGVLDEDIRMYQSSYSTDGWIGDVKSYELDQETGEVDTVNYVFSAAEKLEDKGWSNRIIATYDGTSSGIPFSMGSLTDDQKTSLYTGWEASGVTVSEIVDYLRGDSSNEENENPDGEFRNR